MNSYWFFCMDCIAGELDHDRRAGDLKTLYWAYATDVLSDGPVDNEKVITCYSHFVQLADAPYQMTS